MKANGKSKKSNAQRNQSYFVVVIDIATTNGTRAKPPLSSDHIVTASSAEEAEERAVAERNQQNGFGPEDDEGFIPVHAYSRAELQALLAQME